MQEVIKIDFSKEGNREVWKSFEISAPVCGFHIELKGLKNLGAALYVEIFEPEGQLRFQKLMAYGKPEIGISENGMTTTIGGIVGEIPQGEWRIRCSSMFEKGCEGCMELVLTTMEMQVEDPVGEKLWMHRDKGFELIE